MTVLDEIRSLEVELHHPGVRCDRARLERLLHDDFHEVGRSGRSYDRATIVGYLASRETPPKVVSDAFQASELAPGVALLTYRSALAQGDALSEHTLRSSLWVRVGSEWKIRYHQGTPADRTW